MTWAASVRGDMVYVTLVFSGPRLVFYAIEIVGLRVFFTIVICLRVSSYVYVASVMDAFPGQRPGVFVGVGPVVYVVVIVYCGLDVGYCYALVVRICLPIISMLAYSTMPSYHPCVLVSYGY